MLFRRGSDLAERRPLFDAAVACLEAHANSGAFEGVNPKILDLMDGMIPIGLDRKNRVVLPDSYDPEKGPPVLILRDREYPVIPFSKDFLKSLRVVECNAAIDELKFKSKILKKSRAVSENPCVMLTTLLVSSQSNTPVTLPKLISLPSEDTDSRTLPVTIAHELDHWDYWLHEATFHYGLNKEPKFLMELVTRAERRAYKTSYQVEKNLGYHALMPSVEVFASRYRHMEPAEAGPRSRIDFTRDRLASDSPFGLPFSLAALALSHLYGLKDTSDVSYEEITAYEAAGLITALPA